MVLLDNKHHVHSLLIWIVVSANLTLSRSQFALEISMYELLKCLVI
jgi:hypothetical protein